MKFQLNFEKTFAHPPEKVWWAITDRAALARWLMDNDADFQRRPTFRMWCDDGKGHTDTYFCEVLAVEPPRRMVWSWVLDGKQAEGATIVEFELEPLSNGTRLTVRHSGDRDPKIVEAFKGGWPEKLRQLEQALSVSS